MAKVLRQPPMINGVVHSWANLDVRIGGVPVTGITKISYNEEQAIENIYGVGQYPVGRGYGRITPSASITLLREEIEAIRSASPTGRLQDIDPFFIVVSFIPSGGQRIKVDVLHDVQFTDDGLEASEGDTSNSKELTLVLSHIEHKMNL